MRVGVDVCLGSEGETFSICAESMLKKSSSSAGFGSGGSGEVGPGGGGTGAGALSR